jgi:hypothetical protein
VQRSRQGCSGVVGNIGRVAAEGNEDFGDRGRIVEDDPVLDFEQREQVSSAHGALVRALGQMKKTRW